MPVTRGCSRSSPMSMTCWPKPAASEHGKLAGLKRSEQGTQVGLLEREADTA